MTVIKEFFTSTPLIELLLIVVFKAIEVSIGTMRYILVAKGQRKIGALLAFVEITLWVFIASTVITGIADAPIKGIFYSGGYALGVLIGSLLERKLAVGKVLIQAICSEEKAVLIATTLREENYGVTTVAAEGRESNKTLIMVYANRRGQEKIINNIYDIDEDAMVVTNDIAALYGGHIAPWRKFIK